MDAAAPAVRIDALDMFVELLAQVEDDASSDAFYSRLCEATCALTSMDRAVIFRYDEVRRRVRAAGAYGIDLERVRRRAGHRRVGARRAPVARGGPRDRGRPTTSPTRCPEEFRELRAPVQPRVHAARRRRAAGSA